MSTDKDIIKMVEQIALEVMRATEEHIAEQRREIERLKMAKVAEEEKEVLSNLLEKSTNYEKTIGVLQKDHRNLINNYDIYPKPPTDEELYEGYDPEEADMRLQELIEENINEATNNSEQIDGFNREHVIDFLSNKQYGQENFWDRKDAHTDLTSLSNNELKTYMQIQGEATNLLNQASSSVGYKEPPKTFELAVLDRLANTDYPEKHQDLEAITKLKQDPNESIVDVLSREDWPQIQVGYNLQLGKYIEDQQVEWISAIWVDTHPERRTVNKPVFSSRTDYSQITREEAEKNILIDENRVFVREPAELDAIKSVMREDIHQRYYDPAIVENLDKLIDKAYEYDTGIEDDIETYYLERNEAYTLQAAGFVLPTLGTPKPEELIYSDYHILVNAKDLERFRDKIHEIERSKDTNQERPYDYRTYIDPNHGVMESLNGLRSESQPTAPELIDEMEESVEYGIGEVGDSNEEAIEEYYEEVWEEDDLQM